MGAVLKSLIFNIVFYTYTAFICLVLVFSFALPRKQAFLFVKTFYFRAIGVIEKLFLGLTYRVEGKENLPEGSYILALKHYSTYETLKLPEIFGDVAIIMKQELTWIPFWGWYTKKLGMISVDRGGRQKALASLIRNGKRVIAQGRPILIFPQGTRVAPTDTPAEKPYKVGIAKIAETLNLPVVPVALNSGAFWPKKAFIKKSGVVDFKILPVIPAGLPAAEVLKRLQDVLEPESARLIANAQIRPYKMPGLLQVAIFLFLVWAVWWQVVAYTIRDRMKMLPDSVTSLYKPEISGFPGALDISWKQVTYTAENGTLVLPMAQVKLWPVPRGHIRIMAPQGFTLDTVREGKPVELVADNFALTIAMPAFWTLPETWSVNVKDIAIASGATMLNGEGDIAMPLDESRPVNGTLSVSVAGYAELIASLSAHGLVDDDKARMAKSLLDAMAASAGASNGAITVPVSITDDVVYVSVVRVLDLKELRQPAAESGMPPQKSHSGGSETDSHPVPAPQMPVPAVQP